MFKVSTLLFVCALGVNQAHAVNKCTGADGKISFQDAPCAGKGGQIKVTPANGSGEYSGATYADQLSTRIRDDLDGGIRATKIKVEDKPPSESVIAANKAKCEAAIRLRLKDPNGARFNAILRIGTFMGYRDGTTYPFVKYIAGVNAKNSYGAYAGETNWQCSFDEGETVLKSISEGGLYR